MNKHTSRRRSGSVSTRQTGVVSKGLLRGFSLIELAIVMLVIGLLVGGLLAPLTAQIDQQRINETRRSLAEIKEALVGFAIINGRLPCPATGTIAADAASAGAEVITLADITLPCTNVSGVLPWATLGVSEVDAWGRRYTYRVTQNFANGVDSNGVSFSLTSTGDLTVRLTSGGTSVASSIPAIIISHGKNGFGAFTPQGIQLAFAAADINEAENTNSADANYVDREIDLNPDTAATFDDIVVWISPNILFSRMVAAGRLP